MRDRRHSWNIVACWLILAAVVVTAALCLGAKVSVPGPAAEDTIAQNVGEQLAIGLGLPPRDTLLAVLHGPAMSTDRVAVERARNDLKKTLLELTRPDSSEKLFSRVTTAGDGSWLVEDSFFESKDRHHVLLKADLRPIVSESAAALAQFPERMSQFEASHPGFTVHYLSGGIIEHEIIELIHQDLDRSLWITLPLTLLVLLWAFGSCIAALVPLVIAGVSLGISLGLAALGTHLFGPMSATASQLVVLLVLALGVDYSLLTISRLREERAAGKEQATALALAVAHSGRAIFWSGLTVALSITALLLMHDSVLSSMAIVSLLAVLVTMFSCIVVLPAVLRLLGSSIERGRLPGGDRGQPPTILRSVLQRSLRHPWVTTVLCLAALILVSSAARTVQLGSTVVPEFLPPTMQSVAADALIREHFPDLAGTQFSILVTHPTLRSFDQEEILDPFFAAVFATGDVVGPRSVTWAENGAIVRYVVAGVSGLTQEQKKAIAIRLREQLAPQYLAPHNIELHLSGIIPYEVDTAAAYAARTPLVIGVVLTISFLFLVVAFHSVVVALKAVLLNLLSTGVSFGVLVLAFEDGLIPAWHYGVIESFVPALLFCILFGLSMDYHVFLLSRIREEVVAGRDNEAAVRGGILATARTITSAALIMVVVFLVMATLELPLLKQLGVGLAVAVLVDATIIRSLLLPASMQLLGRWNWYLPRWLESVVGEKTK